MLRTWVARRLFDLKMTLAICEDLATQCRRHDETTAPIDFAQGEQHDRACPLSTCRFVTSGCDLGPLLPDFPDQTCSSRRSLKGGPVCEGMARGEHSPTRLISRASSLFCESARCNRGPRKQASVGSGEPLRETVPNCETIDRVSRTSIADHLPGYALGVVCCSLSPSYRFIHQILILSSLYHYT